MPLQRVETGVELDRDGCHPVLAQTLLLSLPSLTCLEATLAQIRGGIDAMLKKMHDLGVLLLPLRNSRGSAHLRQCGPSVSVYFALPLSRAHLAAEAQLSL